MIETPQVTRTDEQDTAVVRLTIPRAQMRDAMGAGVGELMSAVAAQGAGPAGPWCTHHLRMDPATFDFEICVPVASPVTEAGRVRPGVRAAGTVARTVYHGGYEGLGAAWAELDAWVAASGHRPAGDLWETYEVGPESGDDPAAWRTRLERPLVA